MIAGGARYFNCSRISDSFVNIRSSSVGFWPSLNLVGSVCWKRK